LYLILDVETFSGSMAKAGEAAETVIARAARPAATRRRRETIALFMGDLEKS
jgi:hypothetical protein